MHIVLNTFGASLTKENDMFLVSNKEKKQKVPLDKVRSISISKGARISSDAALLALDNEIEVLFINRSGIPAGRLWSNRYGSITTIRRKQLEFITCPEAVEWIKRIISDKINNQLALLISLAPTTADQLPDWDKEASKLEAIRKKVAEVKGERLMDVANTLRGLEGTASRLYFTSVSAVLPSRYQYASRSKHPATDMFNCLLNYGYGMLYGKVEGALIRAGLDPYIGVFHRDEYNRPVLVYDVIEKFRAWVDYVVISLCMQEVVDEDHFSIGKDGSYWLEGAGKRILIQGVNDYLAEIVPLEGNSRSRENHIDAFARTVASSFSKT